MVDVANRREHSKPSLAATTWLAVDHVSCLSLYGTLGTAVDLARIRTMLVTMVVEWVLIPTAKGNASGEDVEVDQTVSFC